jgi:dTDP-4-amino-4,6-dideoxygalactose transaminase
MTQPPLANDLIRLTDVTVGEEEEAAAARVLRSGWLTMGPEVQAFEREFAAALGAPHAVAVSNGTTALRIAYKAAGLQAGDAFAMPALTFVATLAAGVSLGARPILIDCAGENDLTLSADDLERKLETARKADGRGVKLVVTMPYGGFAPDMEKIGALAAQHGATLVEDACHAPLARLAADDGGMHCLGTFGAAGCFSFFSNKNMATGEGGMIVTADAALADRARSLRSHGMTTVTWDRERGHAADYDVTEIGDNCRMDEMRAAIGREQLKKLPAANAARTHAAALLRERLLALQIDGLQIPFATPRGEPAHHLFVILLPSRPDRVAFRASFRAAMLAHGVQTSVHYPPLWRFSGLGRLWPDGPDAVARSLPVLSGFCDRLVTLPMGPALTEEKIARIAGVVREGLMGGR